MSNDVEIVAFDDNYSTLESFYGKPVYRPEDAMNLEYDFLLICSIYSDEIYKQANEMGIDSSIVIMPVTKYYSKYCSSSIKRKFYDNLNEVIENNSNIQVLDYFDKIDYSDSSYYHINHMYKKGAVDFTKQLNRDIIWYN